MTYANLGVGPDTQFFSVFCDLANERTRQPGIPCFDTENLLIIRGIVVLAEVNPGGVKCRHFGDGLYELYEELATSEDVGQVVPVRRKTRVSEVQRNNLFREERTYSLLHHPHLPDELYLGTNQRRLLADPRTGRISY